MYTPRVLQGSPLKSQRTTRKEQLLQVRNTDNEASIEEAPVLIGIPSLYGMHFTITCRFHVAFRASMASKWLQRTEFIACERTARLMSKPLQFAART